MSEGNLEFFSLKQWICISLEFCNILGEFYDHNHPGKITPKGF
jgi:hypothetical protein